MSTEIEGSCQSSRCPGSKSANFCTTLTHLCLGACFQCYLFEVMTLSRIAVLREALSVVVVLWWFKNRGIFFFEGNYLKSEVG